MLRCSQIRKTYNSPSLRVENANWLKPKTKMTLMSSDDDEQGDDDDDDEFDAAAASSDDDDDEMLEVERQSRLIDEEMKLEQEEAEQELRRTIAQQTSVFHLPTPEELEDDENRVVPPSELRARIEDVLEVLADFKARREPGRSRSEYIERLGKDMAELFGYLQELVDYFLSMFGPNECLEFLEASDKSRPLVVRVNTLKARRKDLAAALMKRGVRLDPLAPWSKVGLKIYESTVPIGATPEYLAGHYMLQSAASMCPVMALGPQPGDRVLDMSAAPGGKTSYISQLMRNKGVVIANDLKPERQKATVANLHRLGVRNVVTCCYDGRKIGVQMRNSFDRILLDAPCSGLGVISRDPSVKVQRTMPEVLRCAHLQKELLVAAIDALNHKSKQGGGFMVYSTCSVAVAENEEVVNYLLSKRDVKLVDTGLDFGTLSSLCHVEFNPPHTGTNTHYVFSITRTLSICRETWLYPLRAQEIPPLSGTHPAVLPSCSQHGWILRCQDSKVE
jgi:ribosomal RNA methyltransferase Nop2